MSIIVVFKALKTSLETLACFSSNLAFCNEQQFVDKGKLLPGLKEA